MEKLTIMIFYFLPILHNNGLHQDSIFESHYAHQGIAHGSNYPSKRCGFVILRGDSRLKEDNLPKVESKTKIEEIIVQEQVAVFFLLLSLYIFVK